MPLIKTPIYLDYHATTPVDERVLEAMYPYFTKIFGNPASTTHAFGWAAEEAVKIAAEQVAESIHSQPSEILWTSGTTESINLALKGVFQKPGNHFITSTIEHKAVLETFKFLETKGAQVTYLSVDQHGQDGFVDLKELEKSIRPETVLVSIIAAHNEIGVIQKLEDIGKITKKHKILFHVDAAQACGKIPIDVQKMNIDLLSASAHKIYGPKGVGFLYVRERSPHVTLEPQIHGGNSYKNLRAGTLPVPLIVGMGKALSLSEAERDSENQRVRELKDFLLEGLKKEVPDLRVNGSLQERLAGNLNVSFPGVKGSDLLTKVRDVAFSSGSACASGERDPSYVLQAMGFSRERAESSVRFGLGRFTTREEINISIQKISEAVKTLRLK